MNDPTSFRTRGYLPHIDAPGAVQFVTFRLADSLPKSVLDEWRVELTSASDTERDKEMYRRVESYLDVGHGSQILKNPVAANIVLESLIYAHEHWCAVHALVVMPTHVHVMLGVEAEMPLSEILRRVKNFTALNIHRKLGMDDGRLWQPEYFDKIVRDDDHFLKTLEYIEWNPVKAKLCADPKRWPYSSANSLVRERLERARGSH
ncbi:MAG: transposase [Actinomycetota bacterium]